VQWDDATVARWLEPLSSRTGELAEVFGERRREVVLGWTDGRIVDVRVRREDGVSARWRFGREERLAFVSGGGEDSVREAVRALRALSGREPLPIRGSRAPKGAGDEETETGWADLQRWTRRLTGILGRHAPRHRFFWRVVETERRVVASGLPPAAWRRRLISVEGSLTAASRHGDEERPIAFHAPDAETTADELKAALVRAGAPRDRPVAPGEGEVDVVLAEGCAAVLFHEILGHALEADAAASSLSSSLRDSSLRGDARVAVAELDVSDDPRRLDLFGGYERDDEGVAPRAVKLLYSGRVGSRLTDRAHARGASSGHGRRAGPAEAPMPRGANVVLPAGSATSDEIARRLNDGLWIEEFRSGSAQVADGTFRLPFARARRVRRGRFTEEIGPGILAGRALDALKGIEPVLGREARACRSLGWCARDGQVVPVQGEAPDVLIRGLSVRPA
jgi:predicted Zn-dependent protease